MSTTTTNPIGNDEARRAVQHGSVKAQVEGDINAEIAAQANQAPPNGEAQKIEAVAGTFRRHAVDEVVGSEREARRGRGVARASQIVDYIFFLIYGLLAIRFVLSLIAAKSSSGFVEFIVNITSPLYAPFKNIVDSPKSAGHTVMLPMLVAIGAYFVLHLAIKGLFRLIAVRKTEI